MKFVAIYLVFWILLIIAAGVMFAAGIISEMSLAIMGFVSASLVFVGLVGFLPWTVDNHYSRFSEMKRAVLPRTTFFVPAMGSKNERQGTKMSGTGMSEEERRSNCKFPRA